MTQKTAHSLPNFMRWMLGNRILILHTLKTFVIFFTIWLCMVIVSAYIFYSGIFAQMPWQDRTFMSIMNIMKTVDEQLAIIAIFGLLMTYRHLCLNKFMLSAMYLGINPREIFVPVCVIIALIHLAMLASIDVPIANLLDYSQNLQSKYQQDKKPIYFDITPKGIWIREKIDKQNTIIISTSSFSAPDNVYQNVHIYEWKLQNSFTHWFAKHARLMPDGLWELKNGILIQNNGIQKSFRIKYVQTSIKQSNMINNIKPPNTFSFYSLSNFIELLKQNGLPYFEHSLYLHNNMSAPLVLLSILLACSLIFFRLQPRFGNNYSILAACMGTVGLNVLFKISGKIAYPIFVHGYVSATWYIIWALPILAILISLYLLYKFPLGSIFK